MSHNPESPHPHPALPTSTLPPPPPRPDRRWGGWRYVRWVHIVALLAAIPAGLYFGLEGAAGILILFVLLVPFEKMFRRHEQPIRRPGLRTDLTYALISPALNIFGIVAGIAIALLAFPLWAPALLLRPLVMGQPGWLLAIEGILLLDVLIYWTHRLSHEIGFFWRFHAVHHSSKKMDWISGVRQHPFDGVIIAAPAVVLIAAGFQFEVIGAVAVIQAVIGLLAHANIRWRFRPLWRIIMTPEFHHWHHANYPDSIHTNYSVGLPLWDMIWGTYHMPRDRRPAIYGHSEDMPGHIPGQMWWPFRSDTRKKYPFPPPWRTRIRRVAAFLGRFVPFRRRKVVAF